MKKSILIKGVSKVEILIALLFVIGCTACLSAAIIGGLKDRQSGINYESIQDINNLVYSLPEPAYVFQYGLRAYVHFPDGTMSEPFIFRNQFEADIFAEGVQRRIIARIEE